MRIVSAILVLAIIFVIYSQTSIPANKANTHPIVADRINSPNQPALSVLNVPAESMRQTMNNAYRLKPDKRFLLAVAQIHFFLSGKETKEVIAEFNNDQWSILYDNKEVGKLPELPEFSDFTDVLTNWIKHLQKTYPLNLVSTNLPKLEQAEIDKNLDKFLAKYSTRVLQQINELWNEGNRSTSLLPLATKALINLSMQGLDKLETADVLPAKALAMLTLSQSLTSNPLVREECLLAHTLGYVGHAANKARLLPETDAVQGYVLKDDQQLKKLARAKNSSIETHYLWLDRLSKIGDVQPWSEWVETAFKHTQFFMPVVKTALNLNKFYGNRNFPKNMQRIILFELAKKEHTLLFEKLAKLTKDPEKQANSLHKLLNEILKLRDTSTSSLIKRVAFELDTLDRKNYAGPFLDLETYKKHIQASFYSSLSIEGRHYLDSLSSHKAARQFSQDIMSRQMDTPTPTGLWADIQDIRKQEQQFLTKLVAFFKALKEHLIKFSASIINQLFGDPKIDDYKIPRQHLSHDFVKWYGNLVNSISAKGNKEALMGDIMALPFFGAQPLFRTLKETKLYFKYADPSLFKTIKVLTSRMDTRMPHRIKMAAIAYEDLLDLKLAENLYKSVFQNQIIQGEYVQIWYAYYTGDRESLKKMLHSPRTELSLKIIILGYLEALKALSPKNIKTEYKQLIKNNPRNWKLNYEYAKHLEKVKDFSSIRPLMQNWLDLGVPTGGLEPIFALNKIAKSYLKQKKYQEGLQVIEPIANSMQAGALWIYAELLEKTDNLEKAETVFKGTLERYPDSTLGLTELAGFYWRNSKYQKAATLIKHFPFNLSWDDWQFKLGDKFAEIFSSQNPEKGLAAFTELIKAGNDRGFLARFPIEVSRKGSHKLAFELHSKIKFSGMGQVQHLVKGYKYIKLFEGEIKADKWLKKNIPRNFSNPASMFYFRNELYQQLWSNIPSPDAYVWMLRAATFSRLKNPPEKDHQKLENYFKNTNSKNYYDFLGKFLMGIITKEELLKTASSPKRRCEFAFFIGFAAQSEGRYEDASDWYRVAVETGLTRNGEYIWAYDTLFAWQREGMSLPRLAEKKL